MGRSSAPPLASFSKQVIAYVVRRLVDDGYDASGRWLASQIEMSHNYVAKRLRYELPFTTTDIERIARAFDMTPLALVEAAAPASAARADPIEVALAAERTGDWGGLALAAHRSGDETDDEFDDGPPGDGI